MKKITVLLLLAFPFSAFSQGTSEQEITACLEKAFQAYGQSYQELILETESKLVKGGYLKDGSGKSYRQFVKDIKERGDLFIEGEYFHPLLFDDSIWTACPLEKSRVISEKFIFMLDSIERAGNISPDLICNLCLNAFSSEELENPLYKHLLFLFLFYPLTQDYGILEKLPPWTDDAPDLSKLKKRNVLAILVSENDSVFVRGKPLRIKNIKDTVKAFISNPGSLDDYAESPEKAMISLRNDRGTSYAIYLKVYQEIKGAYDELRDERSIRDFGSPYQELSPEQQKLIRKAIPLIISEAEPSGF
jgi:biopolymer transport protein ExbD